MGMRQITFEVPEDVAERFLSQVPAAEQSELLTELLRRRLFEPRWSEEQLIAACEAANADPETQEIEREMAALPDTMTEKWHSADELSEAR